MARPFVSSIRPRSRPDFDSRLQAGPIELFEALEKEGRLWWRDGGADGGYLLHIYVDQSVPTKRFSFVVTSCGMSVF
jgi:hypothetical protein